MNKIRLKVSVVIPVYNAEKFLVTCIESALNQTYDDIEIIAVNDGSTDNSLQILKQYSDKITIIDKKNGGTPTALNAGIKIMKGEWFKWLSADDVLYPNAIELLIKNATKLGESAYSTIFYTNYDIINENGKVVKQYIEPNCNALTNFDKNVILLDHFVGNGTTSLIHKSIFDRFGIFDEDVGFQEDYEFWLRCCLLHECSIYLIPEICAMYRIHDTQLTKTRMNVALIHSEIIRKKVLNKLDSDTQDRYISALKKWKKTQYSLNVRLRRKTRDAILELFPTSVSKKIISSYLKFKE